MTEEANLPKEDAQVKKATPAVKKRGRKPSIKKPVAVHKESAPTEEAKTVGHRGWPSGRAFKCVIYGDKSQLGSEVSFQLGDSTKITVLRDQEIVLPWECKSIMDDATVEMPRTIWKNGIPVKQVTEKYTRFPYQNLGEVPWSEYEKFRAGEKDKPWASDLEQ